ncbi:hypothetical protein DV735_g1853, partial [Chaetothyriales sp. CBS 134920]
MILDSKGSLVWTDTQFREPFNMDIQEYKGEPHLTFWAGNKVGGHGEGINYIVNSSYHIVKTVRAGKDLKADLHEFNLLPSSNTALLDAYYTREVDLSGFKNGPEKGWIWEAAFQEVDIDTGEVLFDWRASDHISLTKTYSELDASHNTASSANKAFDWFHINSVDKDDQGNYLVSSRHLHALFCINGITGTIMWQLGGKDNMFKDLTDHSAYPGSTAAPPAITLQHHARWHNNYTSITVFNNGDNQNEASTAMLFDIDTVARTVHTRGVYTSPSKVFGLFEGSISILPSQNILVGYGSAGQWSEFTLNGEPICDVRFTPFKNFNGGTAESYRVFKGNWVGRPRTNPAVIIEADLLSHHKWLYVSWMGATEVRNWRIEAKTSHHGKGDEGVVTVVTVPRDGFETAIDLSSYSVRSKQETDLQASARWKRYTYWHPHQRREQSVELFRAVAIDSNNTIIGTSAWVDAGGPLNIAESASTAASAFVKSKLNERWVTITVGAVIIAIIGLLPCLWLLGVWLRKRDSLQHAPTVEYQPVPEREMETKIEH